MPPPVTVSYHGPGTQYTTSHVVSGQAARFANTRGRVAPPVPLTSASLTVSIESRPVIVHGYRWVGPLNQWQLYQDIHIRSDVMILTSNQGGFQNGFLIGQITPQSVAVRRVRFRRSQGSNVWQINIMWQGTLSHNNLGRELHMVHLGQGLQLMANLSIVVAIGTGVAFGAGFGPCASGIGLSGGLTGAANALASGLASGLTTFIHGIHQSQVAAVSTPAGAQAFWRAEKTNFGQIVLNSIISGTFSGATSFLPGPSSLSSVGGWVTHLLNRLGNHFASIIQTLVGNAASTAIWNPQNITEAQVRRELQQQVVRDAIVRLFG